MVVPMAPRPQPHAFMLLLGLTCATRLLAAPAPLTRWAVVGTPEVAKSGVVDVLTAELSTDGGIELVERQDIRRVLREQELTALGDAQGGTARVRTGGAASRGCVGTPLA